MIGQWESAHKHCQKLVAQKIERMELSQIKEWAISIEPTHYGTQNKNANRWLLNKKQCQERKCEKQEVDAKSRQQELRSRHMVSSLSIFLSLRSFCIEVKMEEKQ